MEENSGVYLCYRFIFSMFQKLNFWIEDEQKQKLHERNRNGTLNHFLLNQENKSGFKSD